MSEVFKLGISTNNNQPINEVSSIEVLANQGVVGDRHFKEFNDPYNQLSLIESENIDYYNVKFGLNIPYIDFRRNIIISGINLNNCIDKNIIIKNVVLKIHELCQPCNYLQKKLGIPNLVKMLVNKSGVRAEIISSGFISIGDKIKIY